MSQPMTASRFGRNSKAPQSGPYVELESCFKRPDKASNQQLGASSWFYRHKAAEISPIDKANHAVNLCEKSVIFSAADILTRLQTSPTLAHDDRTPGHQLSTESLYPKPLCIRIATIF